MTSGPEDFATVHVEGTDHAQIPVLGTGVQTNVFAAGGNNRDVVLVITHEKKTVELSAGASAVLSLEVANHGNRTRHLALHTVGLPPPCGSVVPATMVVRPNETRSAKVVVRARESAPEAGDRDMAVAATDADTGGRADGRWVSNKKQLRVRPKPGLALAVTGPPSRVERSTTYRTVVKVTNTGNTRLSGVVDVPGVDWVLANTRTDPNGRLVDPSLVRLPGEFELGPGEVTEIPLTVTFPEEPPADQRWTLLLRVSAGRSGLKDRICRVPLVQLAAGAPAGSPPPGAAQAEPVAAGWASHRVRIPVPLLVLALIAAVSAGVFAGMAVRPTAAAPAPDTSTAASEIPVMESAAAGVPLDLAVQPADVYSEMPCEPGTWIVVLATVPASSTDTDVAKMVQYESDRAEYVDEDNDYTIKATRYPDACERARSWITTPTKMSTRLVWIGPVPSEAAAARTCKALKKTSDWDCYGRPAS